MKSIRSCFWLFLPLCISLTLMFLGAGELHAGCSPFIGLASINEVNVHNQSGQSGPYFVEIKALDNSILSANPVLWQNWTLDICSAQGTLGGSPCRRDIPVNAGVLVNNWLVIDQDIIQWDYLDLNNGNKHGMEMVLYDQNGDLVDYLSVDGYSVDGAGGCSFPYGTTFVGGNNFNIQRMPDGLGDWVNTGSGNSGNETENDTNNPVPVGSPDLSVADAVAAAGQNMVFTLSLSVAASEEIIISYTTVDGTGVAGDDFTAVSGSITIPAGATSATITVPTSVSATPNSYFFLSISEVISNNAVILNNLARGTILIRALAEYRFEGCDWATGSVVTDELGNHPGVVVQGAHTGPGIDYGGGLCNVADLRNEGTDFNRHISLVGNPIALGNNWSLMMWINFPPSFSNHFLYGNYRYSVIAGGDHDLCWIREHTATGQRYWGASSSPTSHLAPFPSTLAGWHHLTFVGTGANTLLYVDGVYYNYVDYKQTGNYTRIGTTADAVSTTARQNLDTQLDELKFYNTALSAADISAMYANENSGYRWGGEALNCQFCGAVDHLRIEHFGSGLTCQGSEVTLRACANADCSEEYADPVSVTLTADSPNPSLWVGGDSLVFAGNQTVKLRHNLPGPVTLGVINPSPVPTNGYKCFASGVEGDCDMVFHDTGFIFDVPDHIADLPQTVTIASVRKDLTSEQCVPGFQNVEKDVDFWSSYLNPLSGSLPVEINGDPIGDSPGSSRTLSFDDSGAATFTLEYADVGQLTLNASYSGSGEDAGLVMTGIDSFITRPDHFVLMIPGNPAAADATGPKFTKAGEEFFIEVEARNASGNVTPNYGQETLAESVRLINSLVAPAGQDNPALAGTFDPFGTDCDGNPVAGVACGAFSWSEVGIISLLPEVADENYLGTGNVTGAASGDVGRFIPARFGIAANTPLFGHGCPSGGFTYLGQEFPFLVDPVVTVSALDSGGGIVGNYGNAFWKYAGALATRSYTDASGAGPAVTLTNTGATSLAGENNYDGIGTVTIIGDKLTYPKPGTAIAPFASRVDLDLSVDDLSDADAVCYDPDADGNCDPYQIAAIGSTQQRFGRMVLQNAYGSEYLAAPLPFVLESFDGSGYIVNFQDSCTPFDALNLVLSNYQFNLSNGDTFPSGSGIASAGLNNMTLSAPGGGNDGSVDLLYDLDAAGLSWLKDGGLNPTAKATFGIFKGNERLIYLRESVQ